ncbi:TPA: prepilin-type N-terminal cleavage/methylation domain-containing protein [bacterium]|nr:prepilin-type N-terminal cleavage/methylation domain-containing protein [bacterium]
MSGFLKNRLNKGFTLIEIIVSIFIIGLVAVGVLIFFPTSKMATEESSLKTRIANSVVSKMEELRGIRYKGLEVKYNNYNDPSSKVFTLGLDVESGVVTLNDEPIDSEHDLYEYFKFGDWKDDLSKLGVSKGLIEIKRIEESSSTIDNLLSVRIRAEWGKDKSYEITTYISE